MKKLVVLLILMIAASVGYAQPVIPGWHPPAPCDAGDAIIWNGIAWTCDPAGGTITGAANVLLKSDGAGNAVASSWTDAAGVSTTTGNLKVNGYAGIGIPTDANVGLKVAKPSGGNYGLVVSTGRTDLSQDGSETTIYGQLAARNNIALTRDDAGSHANRPILTLTNSASTGSISHRADIVFNTYDSTNVSRQNFIRSDGGAINIDAATNVVIPDDTMIGSTSAPLARLHVRGAGGSSGLMPFAGTVATIENHASEASLSFLDDTNNMNIFFGNGTSNVDGGLGYTTARELVFRTANAQRCTISATGVLDCTAGITTSGSITAGGAVAGTRLNASVAAGQQVIHDWQQVGQVEWQVYQAASDDPLRVWNATSGDVCTISVAGTLNCTGGLSVGGTPVATTSNISGTVGRSARFSGTNTVGTGAFTDNGTNATAQGTLATLGNFTAGDSDSGDAHTIHGRTTLTSANNSNNALFVTRTPSASTTSSLATIRAVATGTYDTTASQLSSYGVIASSTATRSAGGNNLVNTALLADATGGQSNQAIRTDNGDVFLNAISGTTTIGGALTVSSTATISGDMTVGTTTSNAHTITGKLTIASPGGTSIFGNVSSEALRTPNNKTAILGHSVFEYGLSNFDVLIRGGAATSDISIGDTNTGGVHIGATGNATDVLGTLDVDGAADFDSTVNVDGTLSGTIGHFSSDLSIDGLTETVGDLNTLADTVIGDETTDTLQITAKITSNVHYSGTAPTLSSCGTGSTITGNNERFTITAGTGSPSSCTVTFAGGGFDTNAPVCSVTPGKSVGGIASTLTFSATYSRTAITIDSSPALSNGEKIYGRCDGWL